jgi:serine O-acetyltransferase
VSAEDPGRQLRRQIRAAHPRLREAVVADALTTMRFRGEGEDFGSRLDALRHIVRLAWCSDAFLGQVLYRVKTRMLARGIPVLPRIAHRLAMAIAQISIGDPVVVEPGIYVIHGQVVVDGLVRIGAGTVLAPFVTIGLRAGDFNGPKLERGVQVGTGAKIIGPVRVGAGAQIGAGAVVVHDVNPGDTVVGIPARSVV